MTKRIRATLLGQRKLVGRLSVAANICGTPQANLAFECAEDDLDAIEAQVGQLEAQFDAPCNIPPLSSGKRK
ncbi:hypothetical protein LCGC14_0361860 [marine sediment metagenome]|uniref:Uncharacterized protein n=1 Tax=marine sediment metagenome TaxID=412755 RepID=A0A0F9WFU5_9ZZZZ